MKYLIDTCIVSEVMKKNPSAHVVKWIDSVIENDIYLSVLTIGELQKGVTKIKNKKRQILMQQWLDKEIRGRFAERIINIDSEIVEQWGILAGESAMQGVSLPAIDSLIAATAKTRNLVVVTRNIKDFKKCRVKSFDPF